jgi:hypothetical protein
MLQAGAPGRRACRVTPGMEVAARVAGCDGGPGSPMNAARGRRSASAFLAPVPAQGSCALLRDDVDSRSRSGGCRLRRRRTRRPVSAEDPAGFRDPDTTNRVRRVPPIRRRADPASIPRRPVPLRGPRAGWLRREKNRPDPAGAKPTCAVRHAGFDGGDSLPVQFIHAPHDHVIGGAGMPCPRQGRHHRRRLQSRGRRRPAGRRPSHQGLEVPGVSDRGQNLAAPSKAA